MNIIFLIKNFQPKKCGITDYIEKLSKNLVNRKITTSIIHCNKIKKSNSNLIFTDWSVISILKKIISFEEKKIFLFQFSPFLQSRSGFSLRLLVILFLLRIFFNKTKIVINFHETCNQFSFSPKYFIMYILQYFQMLFLFIISHKVYYTNSDFLHRFGFLNRKKSTYLEIFSNINNFSYPRISKKICVTFYASHFNKKKISFFFNFINNFNVNNKKKIFINILGNTSASINLNYNALINSYKLKKFAQFRKNLSEKLFSFYLSQSNITIVSRSDKFEENSGLHHASLSHSHYFLQISPIKKKQYCHFVNNQRNFDFLIKKISKEYKSKKFQNFKNEDKIFNKIFNELNKIIK